MKVFGPLLLVFAAWTASSAYFTPIPFRPLGESPFYPLRLRTVRTYRAGNAEVVARVAGLDTQGDATVALVDFSRSGQALRTMSLRVDGDGVYKYGVDRKLYSPPFPLVFAGGARPWDFISANGKLVLRAEQSDGGGVGS